MPKPRQFHCKCCCWLFKERCLLKALRRCGEIKNPVDFSDPPGFWVFWMVACGYTIPSESRWTTSSRRANLALVWVSTDDQPIELTFIWYPWAAHATIPRADCTVAKVVAMAALVNMMWTFNPWLVNRLNFFLSQCLYFTQTKNSCQHLFQRCCRNRDVVTLFLEVGAVNSNRLFITLCYASGSKSLILNGPILSTPLRNRAFG